jgi:geranylgeranylglycerol-phosphate geranylgeranyltransferase
LSVFGPLAVRTHDIGGSAIKALPLLFIAICTFVINDVDDRDVDRLNHPERPLPTGIVSPAVAVSIYFISIAAALVSIRSCVANRVAFWYYALLVACTSYGYITEFAPSFKAPYVAACTVAPIIILQLTGEPPGQVPRTMIAALFLFSLGRELCGDVIDRCGDPPSSLQRLPATQVAAIAGASQAVAISLLILTVRSTSGALVVAVIAGAALFSWIAWSKFEDYELAIRVMKYDLFAGLLLLMFN